MVLALISGSHGLRDGSNLRLASMIIRALHGAGYMLDLFLVKGWRSCVIAVPSSWLTASASGRGAASHLTIGRTVRSHTYCPVMGTSRRPQTDVNRDENGSPVSSARRTDRPKRQRGRALGDHAWARIFVASLSNIG